MIDRTQYRTISLPEIVQRAQMLTRVDRKYCLSPDQAEQVLRDLDPNTRLLEIGNSTLLKYRSVYFDSPDFRSFFNAAHHRRVRFKVRQRWYVDTNTAFTEIKQAGPRGSTIKTRHQCGVHEVGSLPAAHERWIVETTNLQDVQPVLWNSYRRTTLLLPDGLGRATVDTDLAWWDERGCYAVVPNLVVIETKTYHGNSSFDRALWRHGHRPLRMSKFGAGIAALHPEFPRHRWHRTMKRYFQTTIPAAV